MPDIAQIDATQGAGEPLYLGFAKANQVITKINTIEEGATQDQTGAEIKALLEALADKLSIETGVKETANKKIMTAAERANIAANAADIITAQADIDAAEADIVAAQADIVAAQVDIDAAQADIDGFPDELKNLITHEIQQLENIPDDLDILAAQWGALGALVEWTDWVPTLTGGADLSGYTSARYYRIGDMCFFIFDASNKNVTTAGSIKITLPFTTANTGYMACSAQLKDGTVWLGVPKITINPNTNFIQVEKDAAGTAWVGDETGIYLWLSGFFEIA